MGVELGGSVHWGHGEIFYPVRFISNEAHVRRTIHHELFHPTQLTAARWHGSSPKWMLYNPPGWHYGLGGAAAIRAAPHLNVNLTALDQAMPGFFNLYARTDMGKVISPPGSPRGRR